MKTTYILTGDGAILIGSKSFRISQSSYTHRWVLFYGNNALGFASSKQDCLEFLKKLLEYWESSSVLNMTKYKERFPQSTFELA